MVSIRLWHGYIGIFIAPSVIFFALTGSLQLFNLHESHGTYVPPVLLEKLSAVHKDQVFAQKSHGDEAEPTAETGDAGSPPGQHEERTSLGTGLLKGFFLLIALALTASTLLGLWIALTDPRHRRNGWWVLAMGIILPLGLTLV
jgi:hypothetical protein